MTLLAMGLAESTPTTTTTTADTNVDRNDVWLNV
jgi:hypothetical protein